MTVVTDTAPGLDIMVRVAASLETISGHMARQASLTAQLAHCIYPVEIPAGTTTVSSGTALIGSAELFGPREGIYWDVRRVTVNGLAASDTVKLYRVSTPTSASAVAENEIIPLTAGNPEIDPVYSPGLGACMLRAGQSLMVYGTSLGATTVTVSWDGISIAAQWLGAYLL